MKFTVKDTITGAGFGDKKQCNMKNQILKMPFKAEMNYSKEYVISYSHDLGDNFWQVATVGKEKTILKSWNVSNTTINVLFDLIKECIAELNMTLAE